MKITTLIVASCLVGAVAFGMVKIISPKTEKEFETEMVAEKPAIQSVSASNAVKVEKTNVFAIAMKYWQWSSPLVETAYRNEFKKAVNWTPTFDGTKNNPELAGKLSYDMAIFGVYAATPNITTALACAVFDIASNDVAAVMNLSNAIASFCDYNKDAAVRAKQKEIYADAETVFLYAIYGSIADGKYTVMSLSPLVGLGNLYLDMKKFEDARQKFETALQIDEYYLPAISGMEAYYEATKKTMPGGFGEKAKKKPSEIGKAFNKIDENQKILKEDVKAESEEELETYMNELCKIESVTYADILENIDPQTAAQVRQNVNKINSRMKLIIPNLDALTAFTRVGEDNYTNIKATTEAVAEDLEHLTKYTLRMTMSHVNKGADMLENTGIDTKVSVSGMGSMNLSELMRDATKNPEKYADAQIHVNEAELQRKAMAYGNSMLKTANKAVAGDKQEMEKLKKQASKLDPAAAIMAKNPFDYANSYDILIQQRNVPPMLAKTGALNAYMIKVLDKISKPLEEIREKFNREFKETTDKYQAKLEKLKKDFKKKCDDAEKAYVPTGDGECQDWSPPAEWVAEYNLQRCDIEKEAAVEINAVINTAFAASTQVTTMAYKKLERNIPRMYNSIMKHMVYISDEKYRNQQEDILIGTIATQLLAAITQVIGSYGYGFGYQDERLAGGGCSDPEYIAKLRAIIDERLAEQTNEQILARRAKIHSLKNGVIDEDCEFYKEQVKLYGYKQNFGFFTIDANDFRTKSGATIWIPFGTNLSATIGGQWTENHLNGQTTYDIDAKLTAKAGEKEIPGTMGKGKAEAKAEISGGTTFVVDTEGKIHFRDFRGGAEVSVSAAGATLAVGGIVSTQRGSSIYCKGELSGNAALDEAKKRSTEGLAKSVSTGNTSDIIGSTMENNIPGRPPKPIWNLEYNGD